MKYEYKVVKNGDIKSVEQNLNDFGKDGWECFEIKKEYDELLGPSYTYFLKRAIEEEPQLLRGFNEKYYIHRVPNDPDIVYTDNIDHCATCPNNPARVDNPVIGDSMCSWCVYNRNKVTCVNTNSTNNIV